MAARSATRSISPRMWEVTSTVKGPASDVTVEVYYARDPARTPVLITIPVSLGKITLELVR